jgi:hypothetical protein
MPIQIDIESTQCETKVSNKTGNTYHLQTAYAHLSDRFGEPQRYPREITLPVESNGAMPIAYKVGKYTLSASAIGVNEYGSLELKFPKLVGINK